MKLICLNCLHSFDEPDHLRCPKCKSDKIQEVPTLCIIPSDNEFEEYEGRRYFTKQIEYWKKRCEMAEEVIEIWEPEHYPNNSWTLWMNFRSSGDVAVMLPKPDIKKEE